MNIRNLVIKQWPLICVLVLAALLRIWKLGEYPIHLTNDEAALGYNAYSILKTGKDEHGQILPVVFKSFGDWKPGLYVYLAVPFVFLFDLTDISVRLPSAIAGVIAVLLIYFLGKKLFSNKTAILAAFSLSIMPWHIHFSRGAWEANIALTLLLAAILFFITSFEKNRYLVISALFFGLSLWAYQSAKLASFLPLLILLALFKEKFLAINKKHIFLSVVVGVLISLPIVFSLFTGKGGRLEVMSVFSYTRPDEYIEDTVLAHEDINKNDFIFTVFHSEEYNLFRGVMGRYFNYFSGRFLFFEGDWSNPKHTSPDMGYLLFANIPILLVGVSTLLKESGKKQYLFILLWLLLSVIPSALTRDSAHGVRSLNLVAPLSFLLAFGLESILNLERKYKFISIAGLVGLFVYSFLVYADAYYVQSPIEDASHYLYGYKQTVEKVMEGRDSYERIVFDQSFDQPYIYFLFYTKYPPEIYQSASSFIDGKNGDVGFVEKLENIEFRPINWSHDKSLENTLLVGKPVAFPPEEIKKPEDYNVRNVNYPDGNPAFLLIDPL